MNKDIIKKGDNNGKFIPIKSAGNNHFQLK